MARLAGLMQLRDRLITRHEKKYRNKNGGDKYWLVTGSCEGRTRSNLCYAWTVGQLKSVLKSTFGKSGKDWTLIMNGMPLTCPNRLSRNYWENVKISDIVPAGTELCVRLTKSGQPWESKSSIIYSIEEQLQSINSKLTELAGVTGSCRSQRKTVEKLEGISNQLAETLSLLNASTADASLESIPT